MKTDPDATIRDHRERRWRALGRADLVAARQEIQTAYRDACNAERLRAAAERAYARGYGRGSDGDNAARESARYDALFRDYHHRLRPEALADEGADEHVAAMETSDERARREAFETRLRTIPPVGWGRTSYPAEADRVTAWGAYYDRVHGSVLFMGAGG